MPETFATRLRALRERAGLSQSELARLSGVGQNSISRYEAGQFEPQVQQLLALARALKCKVEELTG